MVNGEQGVTLQSIIVHETRTGYAQGFREDAYSELMPKISLQDIEFSNGIKAEWNDIDFYNKLKMKKFYKSKGDLMQKAKILIALSFFISFICLF